MSASTFEILLPITAVKNPLPPINPGGDCGPCALCAVLGWEQDRVGEIYRMAGQEQVHGLSLIDMLRLLHDLQWRQELIEYADEPLMPRPDDHFPWIWGYPGWTMVHAWFDALRLRLEAGWVGLTAIDFDGLGPTEWKDGSLWLRAERSHWVLLTGARARWEPKPEGGASLLREVRVTDSSVQRPAEWWCGDGELLRRYGGFRVIWLRKMW